MCTRAQAAKKLSQPTAKRIFGRINFEQQWNQQVNPNKSVPANGSMSGTCMDRSAADCLKIVVQNMELSMVIYECWTVPILRRAKKCWKS